MIAETIAHYRVQAKIGAGGMGEVYRATDTRLGRDVALKVLPEAVSRDTERMARFEREAKVLASLNHPHIASIYGLEESNSVRALVMELVEGPTLADRIKQGPIPLEEALPIARQIAEALEYAHERGIIHRDLKPANVKVTPEGQVKVLDFGLAKALEGETAEEDLRNSPTLSAVATRAGVLLGTAAYMSPEQARGKRVDRRADIWAFGCVLCEMLTGKLPFPGETISDTLAAVIRAEPEWTGLPASVPPRIRELLRRCLQKDPRQRLRDIGEARILIEEKLSGVTEEEPELITGAPRWLGWRALALAGSGLLAGALLAALVLWGIREGPASKVIERLSVLPPSGDSLNAATTGAVAISPDGGAVVYGARHGAGTRLYLRALDRFESAPLPSTDGAGDPFFSPDGQWIGFFANGKLKKISVHGGEPVSLCDAVSSRGATWGPDDMIVFTPSSSVGGLMRVSSAGGTPQAFSTPDTSKNERSHRWAEILPGGKAVVFVIAEAKDLGAHSEDKIAVERVDTHERKLLPIRGTYPRYSPSGHLLFVREGRVFAVPFDLKRLDVTGPPAPVLDGVATFIATGAANFALSRSGSLAYIPASAVASEGTLTWVDRGNQTHPLPAPPRAYFSPRVSPDGQRVAMAIASEENVDVWVYHLARGTLTRLTFDGRSGGPVWSPDGKRIAFITDREGGWAILSKTADGGGAEEALLPKQDCLLTPESWSPDGKFLSYRSQSPDTGLDVFILPLEGERKPRPFVQTKFNKFGSKFSPDGHWIAYNSAESGRNEVYVQPFPGPGGKWQVSTDGGSAPVWARNGRELFYLTATKLMSVNVTTQPNFSASTPKVVADIPPGVPGRPGRSSGVYDVSPDGQRLLFVKASEEHPPLAEVRVIVNWAEELRRRAPMSQQP